jgi:D-3-phosphoglycerate dehydrogenase / 2-oxoglutarate reductase
MKSVYVDCSPFMENLLSPQIRAVVPDLNIFVGDHDRVQLQALLTDAVAVLNGHTLMDRELLSGCPNLKSIVYLGTGASSFIDISAANELGIAVRIIRNFGDRTVAEHTFALILSAARNIARMDRDLRSGTWDALAGLELQGKILGVVGTGAIGSELIRIADRFGMKVLAWNRSGVPDDLPCRAVELDSL